jgi:hypothetical protein
MVYFDRSLKAILLAIAVLLAMIALRPLAEPAGAVLAQTARFEHVQIVSPMFLYKGNQGILVMDRRNANIWFIPKLNEQYQSPVFVTRLPFDKLDQAPQ